MNKNMFITFFYMILLVGIAGHFAVSLFGSMLYITPVVLLILGLLMIFISKLYLSGRFILWLALSYIFTLTLEIIGVQTGIIFGVYSYGNVLGYKVSGVPLIIGINWMLVILGAVNIACIISKNIIIIGLVSSLLAVVFDLVLEPVAMNFGYWEWNMNVIPLQNYLAWFVISFIISLSAFVFKVNIHSNAFINYYIGLLLFFFILNFK